MALYSYYNWKIKGTNKINIIFYNNYYINYKELIYGEKYFITVAINGMV